MLASIYGDISSERGEARLNKISCTRADGTILEKPVQGYLSFAGKEGIKGRPVMRNGKILEMAGLSGLLSGFSSGIQQASQTQAVSPLGQTTTIQPGQVWRNGLAGGAGNAMSLLASYYVKRADQYHPIIEIGSSTVATVVFQTGFSLKNQDKDSNSIINTSRPSDALNDNNQELQRLVKQAQAKAQAIEETRQHQASQPNRTNGPFSNVN